jgi:hypothetical protein
MSIGTWLRNGVRNFATSGSGLETTYRMTQANLATTADVLVDPRQRYGVLRRYYYQNGLYEQLARALYQAGLWNRATKPLRNPCYRIVEAYPAHLWPGDLPGALPIVTENAKLPEAIQQVWQWSNWASRKQVMARWLPMLGDVFLKVVRPQGGPRVWLELVDPAHVAAFETDPRGNLTWIRIEVPQTRDRGGTSENYIHVEVWSKDLQSFRRWEVLGGLGLTRPERDLGAPLEEVPFAAMGIDFVPLVHAKFIDVGEDRGVGAYLLQLDKIDAVNADATRLAQMLFRHNQALWALHGIGNDPSGRPLPGPRLDGAATDANGTQVADWVENQIIQLPGASQLTPLVPALQYEAHRLVNGDGILDLEHDCPEMAYWRVTDLGLGDISGRALKLMLGPFIKRVEEARGNAEDALARADAMALSLAAAAPALPKFAGLGNYDAGDFEHGFSAREVLPLSELETGQAEQAMGDAAIKKLAAGWSQRQVWRDAGLDDAAIQLMEDEKAAVDVIPSTEQ